MVDYPLQFVSTKNRTLGGGSCFLRKAELYRNVFWSYLDHLVAQRDHFCQKMLLQVSSLPKSPACVISRKSVSRGYWKRYFSWNRLSKRLNGPRRSKIYSRMLVRPPKKGLVTTPADFEIVTHFRDFDPPHHPFGKESPAGTKNRVEKINFWWFFKITPGGHQTFLGPN